MEKEDWGIFYDKRTDMVTIGRTFPGKSFYHPVDDGFMLRIDSKNKIHGFAIENAKHFLELHPEFTPLYFVVYPYRSLILLVAYFLFSQTLRGMNRMKAILSLSESYVITKASHA